MKRRVFYTVEHSNGTAEYNTLKEAKEAAKDRQMTLKNGKVINFPFIELKRRWELA